MKRRRARHYRRPSPTVAQPEQPVGVTVLMKKPFDAHGQSCDFRYFNETTLGGIEPYVKAHHSRWPNNLVVIVVEVTRPETPCHGTGSLSPDLLNQLTRLTEKRFPRHIVNSVVNGQVRQPYVPGEAGNGLGNAAWVLKYRGGTGVFHGNPEPSPGQADQLLEETTWVAAWVGRRVTVTVKTPHGEKAQRYPPMAVVIICRHPCRASSDPNYYGKKMAEQYTTKGTNYRWTGVREQPLFLFMDMDRLFNNFQANVTTSSLRINKYMEPKAHDRRHGVIPRVGRLRNALLTLAEFRKEFKTHELARKSMEKIVQYYVDENTNHSSQTPSDRLCDRLYQLGNELETLNLEVEMLREQCTYLMDTEFNTVAARTDARLSILTILAFVLSPAGFVVSLFSVIDAGTTQLIISTIIVAFFSIVIYIVVHWLYGVAERKRLPNGLVASKKDHMDLDW